MKRWGIAGIVVVVLLLMWLWDYFATLFGWPKVGLPGASGLSTSGTGGSGGDIFQPMKDSEYSGLVEYWRSITKMESNGYKSTVCLRCNNICGMKMPRERQTTAFEGTQFTGSSVWWATYHSMSDCAQDLVLYMRAKRYPTKFDTLADLVAFMGSKGYYGEESFNSYYNKVLAWVGR